MRLRNENGIGGIIRAPAAGLASASPMVRQQLGEGIQPGHGHALRLI